MNLAWCIKRVHYKFSCTSNFVMAKGFFIDDMITFVLRPILMLDMSQTKETWNRLWAIAHMLELIWSLDIAKNNGWSLF